jgi:hypothetical protein
VSLGLLEVLGEVLGESAARHAEGLEESAMGRLCAQSVLSVLRRFILSTPPPTRGATLSVRVHQELAFHLLRFPGLAPFVRVGVEEGAPSVMRGTAEALIRELEAAVAGESQPDAVACC